MLVDLALFGPMEYSIKLHTIQSGWSIVSLEGSTVIFCKHTLIVYLSQKIYFLLANSADPNEMPHDAAFHLGLHCFCQSIYLGVSYGINDHLG